jgi:hypothetical protein
LLSAANKSAKKWPKHTPKQTSGSILFFFWFQLRAFQNQPGALGHLKLAAGLLQRTASPLFLVPKNGGPKLWDFEAGVFGNRGSSEVIFRKAPFVSREKTAPSQ